MGRFTTEDTEYAVRQSRNGNKSEARMKSRSFLPLVVRMTTSRNDDVILRSDEGSARNDEGSARNDDVILRSGATKDLLSFDKFLLSPLKQEFTISL